MEWRENQSILGQVRTLINASKMPVELWAEAVGSSTYVSNRSLRSNSINTPFELWFGRKPNVGNLKIFGQQAIVLKPEVHRSKLDEKGQLMNFVGYTENFQNFRFYNPCNRSIEISCHPIFLEVVGPIKSRNLDTDARDADTVKLIWIQSGDSDSLDQIESSHSREIDFNDWWNNTPGSSGDNEPLLNSQLNSMDETLKKADESHKDTNEFIQQYKENETHYVNQAASNSRELNHKTPPNELADLEFSTPQASTEPINNASSTSDLSALSENSPPAADIEAQASYIPETIKSPLIEETEPAHDRDLRRNPRRGYKAIASGKWNLSALVAQEQDDLPCTFDEAMSRHD